MPATRSQRVRVYLHASTPWRKLLPHRTVRRTVQGVSLYLPWSHVLPDYAKARPTYGQNLVDLAAGLVKHDPGVNSLRLLDIGANVGDSTVQILDRVDGTALCVEGDPYWLDYLRRNTGHDPRVTIEAALLTPSEAGWQDVSAVRTNGTTRFVPTSSTDDAVERLSVARLRATHPDFDDLRLVKSDTDGFDPSLVVAVEQVWQDVRPVLFFEFDPTMVREVTGGDANDVWAALAGLGYSDVAVWDNTGDPLGRLAIGDAAEAARTLEPRPVELGYHFWDVAVRASSDTAAAAVFDDLVPMPFDPRGTRT